MKVSRNQACPCGSGKKYKYCCIEKDTENYETVRIPVNKKMQQILDKQKERFREVWGRDPEDNDPIFGATMDMSEEEYKEHVTKMLTEIGVSPAIIYAFNKLGFCLTKEQWKYYTDDQKISWNNAIDEYKNIKKGKIKIVEHPIIPVIDALFKNLDKLNLLYQLILSKYSDIEEEIKLSGTISINDYIAFCLTKNVKTIKAIDALLENHYGEDALNLTRTNFENYLEIVYAKYNPQKLSQHLLFSEGVNKGTHRWKGKKIVNIETGESFETYNNYEKAVLNPIYKEEDIAVYKYLYDLLSSYTHLDLRTAENYIDDDLGFYALRRNMKNESLIFLLIINFMLLDEIKDISIFKPSEKDIKNFMVELGTNLRKLIDLLPNLPVVIITRINKTMEINKS